MKNNSSFAKYTIVFLLILAGFSSCQKTDTILDPTTNRMFRPITFTVSNITSTTADAAWTVVPGGTKYLIETSQDSLKFENKLVGDTIALTLATTTNITCTLLGLAPGTPYSVRVSCLSNDPAIKPSKYQQLYFVTSAN